MVSGNKSRKRGFVTRMAELISPNFPLLKKKLALASIDQKSTEFIERVFLSSVFLSFTFLVLSGILLTIQIPPRSLFWLIPPLYIS
jgi:hypothetical protein